MILIMARKLQTVASILISVSLAIVLCSTSTNGFRLNKNGGYDILVAIEENAPKPEINPLIYFNKMRLILQLLSNSMYTITKEKFFINSIDFLVPEHWGMLTFDATTQSYDNADIRVSEQFKYFRVENPNSCGLPGKYIEAPLEFFHDSSWYSKFGTPWKALITQWARYRWGIWEEHGYPGDSRFPYFYQQAGKPGWTTTGCSDIPINGTYMTIENRTCDVTTSKYPGDDCRLFPDWEFSAATTSIMNFHWIENVQNFCDESNHIRDSPNRQNRNCGHRSAWEIIRETPDYKSITEQGPIRLPILQMYIYAAPKYPRLYVLLDRGDSSVPSAVHRRVYYEINQLLTAGKIYEENVAKISSFPNINPTNSADILKTEVEWSYVQQSQPFQEALLNSSGTNIPSRRDFSTAIQIALEELAVMNNQAGSILIVVKAGATRNSFGTIGYERDVMTTLQENPRIKVYSIEILQSDKQSQNLNRISSASGGKHVSILNSKDIENNLAPVTKEIARLCVTVKNPEPIQNRFANIYRGMLLPNHVNEVPVQAVNLEQLQLHITTNAKLRPEQFFIQPSTASIRKYKSTLSSLPSIAISAEWNEGVDPSRRYTYSIQISNVPETNSKSWKIYYECDASVSDCTGILHIFGRKNIVAPTLPAEDNNNALEIVLSTSSRNVDMADRGLGLSASPFTIFASVHKYGQPVTNVIVTATIQKLDSNETWTVPLTDDGLAAPDLYHNDGVYSQAFIPPQDGHYKIFAFVKNKVCSSEIQTDNNAAELSNGIQFLLPDQKNIGCFPNNKNSAVSNSACVGTEIKGTYGRVVFASGVVHVTNADKFKLGQPFRTLDLEASVDLATHSIIFMFNSPKLLGSDNKGTSYTIYHSEDSRMLVGNLDESFKLASYPTNPPGTVEIIRVYPRTTNIMYYAIQAHNGIFKSGPSNIVALKLNDFQKDPNGTTTTPVTTPTPTDLPDPSRNTNRGLPWEKQPKIIVAVVVGSLALLAAMGFVSFKIVQSKYGRGNKPGAIVEGSTVRSQPSHRVRV